MIRPVVSALLALLTLAAADATPDEVAAFLEAARKNDLATVRTALAKEPKLIDATTRGRRTALYLAAEEGHLEMVTLLIAKGADVSRIDRHGYAALHRSAGKGHTDVVKLLIAKGADVNHRSKAYPRGTHWGSWTPLHMAAREGHKDTVEILLKKGADINARGDLGHTPLYEALIREKPDMVKLLIDKGADLDVKDLHPRAGYTAIQLAIAGYPDIAKTMIKKGANIELRGRHQMTALHVAVSVQETELVKLLLKKGADVNAVSRREGVPGETPIDLAWGFRRRNRTIADILRKHGGKHARDLR